MSIERLDPLGLDLGTADQMAEVTNLSNRADGIRLPALTGPTLLGYLRHGSDGTPADGVWVSRDDDGRVTGRAQVQMPRLENRDSARLQGSVRPDARRGGVGRAMVEAALALVDHAGRRKVYTGAFEGSAGVPALPALGFNPLGSVDAVRRIDLHAAPYGLWEKVYDEAAGRAAEYELVRLVGPTPPELLDDLVTLHAAINDAPLDDPEKEHDTWTAERVSGYDRAMAARRQTVFRVLARHRGTGEWAGMSIVCVDEFAPSVAFQEDTSVLRGHRGHRLGLLMKADMLRRLAEERPEVGAVDTWNATTNHHMIAVNERLGAVEVARYANHRMLRG